MNMTPVKAIPFTKRRDRNNWRATFEEFMAMRAKYVKLDTTGYTKPVYCYKGAWAAVKNSGYPIKVHVVKDEVYLEKLIF